MRPGTNQTIQSQSPSATAPVAFDAWMIAGITAQGPLGPFVANSLSEWQGIYGGRGTMPILSDSVETFFNQGGSQTWTSRVVGPSAVTAFVTLVGSGSAPAFTVDAIGPGAYANGTKVVTVGTGPFTITIEDSSSNVLEVSSSLTSVADAVAYGKTSAYVRIIATGTAIPTAGTFTLATGADDLSDVTVADYTLALNKFTADEDPNVPTTAMVSTPGQTSSSAIEAVATFCTGTAYVGIADLPDGVTSASTLVGDAAPITATGVAARQVALFAPWLDIGPAGGTAGNRGVPPSAFYAGRKSALIVSTGNPNIPAAGANGVLSTAVAAHATWNSSDRQTLNTAGINIIRPTASGFRIYGNVTAVNRLTDPLYFMLSNSHLDGAVSAQAQAIQESFVFTMIDGLGIDVANYGAELVAEMTNWWNLGALFGPDGTPATAFSVDYGPDVNTPTTAAEGELLAVISYARAPGAEQVNLNIVRASAAQGV